MSEQETNKILIESEIKRRTAETREQLRQLGLDLQCDYACQLTDRKDTQGELYNGQVYWLRLETENDLNSNLGRREGKLFVPDASNTNRKLVCLYPGTPGNNIGALEKRHANVLLKKGYTVWVARHNGTKMSSKLKDEFIGSEEKFSDALTSGEDTLGGRLNGFQDILYELAADLTQFGELKNIDEIVLIGHSFGATSVAYSLAELRERGKIDVLNKITKFISLGGFYGNGVMPKREEDKLEGTRFTLGGMADGETKDGIEIMNFAGNLDAEQVRATVKDCILRAMGSFYQPTRILPEKIQFVSIISPTDKYLTFKYLTLESAIKHFDWQRENNNKMRGLMITDLTHSDLRPEQINENAIFGTEFAEPSEELIREANLQSKEKYGGSQRSLANLRPETLLRLVALQVNGCHKVAFRSQDIKNK